MFTGIIQGVARIQSSEYVDGLRVLRIVCPDGFADDLGVGGSVSVNGVCLTATAIDHERGLRFDVVSQSLATTTLDTVSAGRSVNVERAVREGSEIGGHRLSGHVDCMARVDRIVTAGSNKAIRLVVPHSVRRYVFSKGSIALDGVSLTISACSRDEGWFESWLIPETRRATTLDALEVGDAANIEIDRETQVVVDTLDDRLTAIFGALKPILKELVRDRGLAIDRAPVITTLERSKVLDVCA